MEGPTPVSALIHAATMVTAGVYVVARSHIFFEHFGNGARGCCGDRLRHGTLRCHHRLVQTDIKRVSPTRPSAAQLYVSRLRRWRICAGIFHLMTHAFSKRCFSCRGSVIHRWAATGHAPHGRHLSTKIKVTYWTMLIATLAIAGFRRSRDFSRKTDSFQCAYVGGKGVTRCTPFGLLTALLTSFYMFRFDLSDVSRQAALRRASRACP